VTERLRSLRHRLGWSQQQIADACPHHSQHDYVDA